MQTIYDRRREWVAHFFASDPSRKAAAYYFTWLDEQTDFESRTNKVGRRGRAGGGWRFTPLDRGELAERSSAIQVLLEWLGERMRERAHAYPGVAPRFEPSPELRHQLELVAELLMDGMLLYYSREPGGFSFEERLGQTAWTVELTAAQSGEHELFEERSGSGLDAPAPGFFASLDLSGVAEGFEYFAEGSLRPPQEAVREYFQSVDGPKELQVQGFHERHFQPDAGDKFFRFAELALACMQIGYQVPLWKRLLPVFVRCGWIVASRYAVPSRRRDGSERDVGYVLPEERPERTPGQRSLRRWFEALDLEDVEHEFGFLLTRLFPASRDLRADRTVIAAEAARARRAQYSSPGAGPPGEP